ncbi:NFX1-type zinc finger-containing protein 1, partial [Osmerus eperlanus]|uniref:NFX1-type zinc finger-containing protein 1 n=1 Tax=Osmerus eperlanus TaxID=29151 RepID=UPI002E14CD3F
GGEAGREYGGGGGGGERGRGRGRSTENGSPYGFRLGFRSLEQLLGKEPSEVAITLSSGTALQDLLNEQEMRQDLVQLLCQVLCKAFQARTDRRTVQHLAGIVKNSGFTRTMLPHYVAGMGSEPNPARRQQYPNQLDHILTLLSEVLSIFPASSVQAVSMLVALLRAAINGLRASGVDILPRTEENLERLQGLVGHLQEKTRDGTLRSDKDSYSLLPAIGDTPAGEHDYRTLPIYPSPEEFHLDQRPLLPLNVISERYASVLAYLDTHFRLLREDFVRPLREGIQQLLQEQQEQGRGDAPQKKHFDDIRVYFDTRLVVPMCTHSGIAYKVQFDSQPLKFVRWQNSKRLLYGSLVCLSCDNFENFLFATVSDREPTELEKGFVQLIFCEQSRAALEIIETDQVFCMVETTAYFEAYRYVLEGLQELEEEDLPFQRYLVECQLDVHPPAYLPRNDTYNLAAIAAPEFKSSIKPFNTLDPDAWPPMEQLGLDESQMKALQMSLTKELAIIQGPPGTGKTYVGLKIAQALLTNRNVWNDVNDQSPMLVVCYTNHALDQFLEGIQTFLPQGIVRVGGRSTSEVLKPFSLRELSKGFQLTRRFPAHLRRAIAQMYDELRMEEDRIMQHSAKLECSLKGVLREHFLQKFISDTHWDSLVLPPGMGGFEVYGEKKQPLIVEWLGMGYRFQQRAAEPQYGLADMEEEEEEDMEVDDLIEIAEEAALIQAERYVDDEVDHQGRRGNKQRQDENAQMVADLMLAMNLDNTVVLQQDQDGFEFQSKQRKRMKKRTRKELGKSSAMSVEDEAAIQDVWALSLADRWRLYRLWVSRYRLELRQKVLESEQAYQDASERLAEMRLRQTMCILKDAKVIGMTTTGAARLRKVLQEVQPRLVIVEEAAEVLEAHTITTLSRACQHLILIGDHQQLRPSANVYELAKNYSLEVSMFERLVKMKFPYVRLNYQHRMRPDIARLLTPHIYKELENHPSVMEYENIKGLLTNMFFVEHKYHEEEIRDGKSHQNLHEARFVVALCRYLLLQGYKPHQITILTTYTGQLHCLRNHMPAKEFTGVKVHVVDKYQGEENDIVLLSLVRSNPAGRVGFLNIPNRVCVALSRAKKGLYCIGNMAMLSKVPLWSNILHTLKEKDQVGPALTLCCQNHPERHIRASGPDDFLQAPEGGCILPCEHRLDCGHVCASVCHPYDQEHKQYECAKTCQKVLCERGHKCPRMCNQKCPEACKVKVEKTVPKCQHEQMVPCHQDPDMFVCQVPCVKTLLCGHPCVSVCGEPCTINCLVKVPLELKCGHRQEDACHYRGSTMQPVCRVPCENALKCGHACAGTCHSCHQGRYHVSCVHRCQRLLVCSHTCREPCTRDCPSCRMPCQNRCVHSVCKKACGQPCALCVEPCDRQCPHQRCSRLCHEPCDRPPCDEPCTLTLACGHPCVGLCGSSCPDKCRVCHREEVTEIFFGTEDEPDARFIQLEDCGHVVEFTAMDRLMEDDGQDIRLKECPRCRTPVRRNFRYGAKINQCLAEIEKVKEKINGQQSDIQEQKKVLITQWRNNNTIPGNLPVEYSQIRDQLQNPNLTVKDLWVLENKMAFLEKVDELLKICSSQMSSTESVLFEARVEEFLLWLMDLSQKFTDQQASDLQSELQRLSLLADLNARCKGPMSSDHAQLDLNKAQVKVTAIRKVLDAPGPFSQQDEQWVTQELKELDKTLPRTGLGLSDQERKMVVSAMQLAKGHWYKCPNGHVYAIGDCGGAMVSRACPECGATIGGQHHTLSAGNSVATEMDGAQHAAWSNENNMFNQGLFNHFG